MATRTIAVDSLQVTLEDRDAQIVERALAKFATDLATAQAALATAQTTAQNDVAKATTEAANAKAEVQTKDAELTTIKSQLADAKMTPQKLDQMVAARVATVQRAKAIIGDSLVVDGKTESDMRKQVVFAKLGDAAKDWNDDMINASFNTLSVADNGVVGNGLQHVVGVLAVNEYGSDPRGKAYEDYNNDISNRWKTAGGRVAQ